MDECVNAFPQFLSPVAIFANRMLHADLSQPKNEDALSGLLIRTEDVFALDNFTDIMLRNDVILPNSTLLPLKYMPSSYLHASIRGSEAIYQNYFDKEKNQGDYALLFGTKFSQNTAFKEFQKGDNKAITVEFSYPHDAATIDRGTVFDKDLCRHRSKEAAICIDGESCLAHGPGGCGGCKVKPEHIGDFLARYAEINDIRIGFWYESCYYDSLADTVTASNSAWDTHRRWSADVENGISEYQGYNECATSLNIGDKGMADAIVLTLHHTNDLMPQSVCNFPNHVWLRDRLQLAFDRGHGDLPVLFYRETRGIHSIKDCVSLFGGHNCDDAWQKEFFSQEYFFGGACLHKPPGCDEVYYFPADGEQCSSHTDMGKDRIAGLCRDEKDQDARTAYEKFMKPPKERTFTKNELDGAQTQTSSHVNTVGVPKHHRAPANLDISVAYQLPSSTGGIRSVEFVNGASDYKVSSTIVVQEQFSIDWATHVLFLLIGMIVGLFFRAKIGIAVIDRRK